MEVLAETLRQSVIVIEEFQQESQPILNSKINKIIEQLKELDSLKGELDDVEIPFEVLSFIDEGKNPDLFTYASLQTFFQKTQDSQGKLDAFQLFKELLQDELQKEIPHNNLPIT